MSGRTPRDPRRAPTRIARSLRSHHLLVAGVIDAGVSSAATFVVGLAATYTLRPDELGAYALAFSVFVLSAFIPAELVFQPTEIAAVDYPPGEQLPHLRTSLTRGAAVSLGAAVMTTLWVFVAPADMPRDSLPPLAITCAAATFVSPLQDHVRRMLHIARASWRSVVVAVVQMGSAIASIAALVAAAVPAAWIPFGALVIANVASLSIGLLMSVRDLLAPASDAPITRRRLLRSGRPLLVVGLAQSATSFVVSWLVSSLAGAATLGYVEAARVVSQPVAVLQTGLGQVLGPRATRAGSSRDPAAGRRVNRQFDRLILLASVGWMLVVSGASPWNPLPRVLPTAYVVPGLVTASVVAFTLTSLPHTRRFELFGARRERLVARSEVEGNVVRVAIAAGVGWIGAFAVPLGLAALGCVRWLRATRWLAEYYRAEPPTPHGAPVEAD